MSTNEGRPVEGRVALDRLFRELRVELWLLRLVLKLFRWRLGRKDSWRRTHGISMLHNDLCWSQGVMCGMWGWADFNNSEPPIIHTSSYACGAFRKADFDLGLAQVMNETHRMLATEIMEQVDLVQDERERGLAK